MTPSLKLSVSSCLSLAATMISAFSLAGCGAAPDESSAQGTSELSATSDAQPQELLKRPWHYVPSASCGSNEYGTITGNDMSFGSGGYCSEGNGEGFKGFTFEQHVHVVAGGTYDLTLDLSSFNGWLAFIATQFTASIAGVSQTAQATSDSIVHLTFTIGALPAGKPTITFNFRPPAAQVGPVNGGIFLTEEGCDVKLSLVRTN